MISGIELVSRLVRIADAMSENRSTQIGDQSIRTLRDEVTNARRQMSESEFVVDYEAQCLVDCLAELAYARTDKDQRREERALMYVSQFRTFLRIDVERATRKMAS